MHRDQFPLYHRKIGSSERIESLPCKLRRVSDSLIEPRGPIGVLPDEVGVEHKKITMGTKKSVALLNALKIVANTAFGIQQMVGSHVRLRSREGRRPVQQEIIVRMRAMWVAHELGKIISPIGDDCHVRRDGMVQPLDIEVLPA